MNSSQGTSDKSTKKEAMLSPNSKSPFSKSSQGKNLTGTSRHLRDLAADVHGIVQQWNNSTLEGLNVLRTIVEDQNNENFTIQLQDYCDKLEDICCTLGSLAKDLEQIAHRVNILITLNTTPTKLFATWQITAFGHAVESIHKAYNNEMRVKFEVLENIAHCHKKSQKMLYLSAWLYQPLLPENITILLEAMLTETGHR